MSQIIRDITEIARCGAQYRTEALAPMGLKACHASYLTEICAHPASPRTSWLPESASIRATLPDRQPC